MTKYLATIRVRGKLIRIAVFADSSTHAQLLLQYQFGMDCMVAQPVATTEAATNYRLIDEVAAAFKPLTPEKARLAALKRQKDSAARALQTERDRQKVQRAQQQIRTVVAKNR